MCSGAGADACRRSDAIPRFLSSLHCSAYADVHNEQPCQLYILALQGIYNLPNCQTDEDDPRDKPTAMCLTVQRLVAAGAYLPFIRQASHL
jgi:hypothetical protein